MFRSRLSHAKLISIKFSKIISILVFSIFGFETLFFPLPTFAEKIIKDTGNNQFFLPSASDKEYVVSWTKYTTITAYNSLEGQTDSTPCITANGFDVCKHATEDTVAANFLKFGTKIRIPELFGDRVFVVRDRMNKRYTNRIDVWMINKEDAKKLGKRLAKIEVLE
ncbi:hypothetical protein C0584_02390 [Candidatus Parcubacteria bacterium]|nr:MAG: hypothetical protein C0584_02390 [Candidatus Parcubacteria bacterium]